MKKLEPKNWARYRALLTNVDKVKSGEKSSKKILLVDGMNLFIRSFCAVPLTNSDGEHVGGIAGSLNSLKYAIKMLNPSKVIVIFDGKGGSKLRRDIYPEYKGNRGKGLKNLNRTFDWANEEAEEKSAIHQLSRFLAYLDELPITNMLVHGIEADDAIAYVANNMFMNDNKVIMSTDKDFYQLVTDKVSIWRPTTKEVVNPKFVLKNFGILPENFVLYRAMDGDKSDNVPGVKGVGLKTVLKLYPELGDSEILPLSFLFEKAEENLDIPKYKLIFNHKEIIERNHKIMQLSVPLMSGTKQSEIVTIMNDNDIPVFSHPAIRKLLLEDRLIGQFKNLSTWQITYNRLDAVVRSQRKLLKGE
jgi:5'-3' exonuclease